jgi:hypothetical protein
MYGMIHQAAREMAVALIGRAEWDVFAEREGLGDHQFIGMAYYPDADTQRLVQVISDRLGLSTDEALFAFGRFWVEFAGNSSYARMLTLAGNDLEGFLDNLDRMHASIKSNMPRASMPSFQLVSRGPDALRILYRSERPGLARFVHGILTAVAERFGEHVRIDWAPSDDGVLFELTRVHDHG